MPYDSAREQRATYSRWARLYDFSTKLAELIYRFDDTEERRKAVKRLALEPGGRALEVTVGTGANVPLLAERVGPRGVLVGVDVTPAMLRICADKLAKERISAHLVEGDAVHLPFPDAQFDAVLNHGGFNGLDDRMIALSEMIRVAKPGGKIVIADEGMSERKKSTFLGRLFLNRDPWLATEPPIELLPPAALYVHLTHIRAENWYVIDFVNP